LECMSYLRWPISSWDAHEQRRRGAAVEGLAAFAHALEHLNLAWAYCGFTLRLPMVHQAFQFLTIARVTLHYVVI
jgi:hypothetical protein